MNIIINTASMVPIYEQIVEAVRKMVISGELAKESALPSVRELSRDLKISALTVKKAYDCLEEEGLVVTIHGKGTYVKTVNTGLVREAQQKEIEKDLEKLLQKAKLYGITGEEVREMITAIAEL